MTVHTPVYMQPTVSDAAIDYSAQEWRQMQRALLTASSGVGGEQGVMAASGFQVTQRGAGANFSVDVSSGLAFVVGDDVTSQGTYQCWNDGTVNVATPSAPGSGTQVHRIVLQVQDKLNNGTWAGYTGAIMLLADTGSGTPAEPNSAITLALVSIAAGQVSVQNANITDYRQRVGQVVADKTSDTARSHNTTFTDDPDLQLLDLAASSTYALDGLLVYTGFNDIANNQGSLTFKWRLSAGSVINYTALRSRPSDALVTSFAWVATDTPAALTTGTTQLMGVNLNGILTTGAAPAYAVLQWCQNNDSGTATTMKANSGLRCRRG